MDLDPQTQKRLETFARIKGNLPYFATHCLQIRDKQGLMTPFIFNKAQEYTHRKLEAQKAATGKIRALILKGRQQGMSTYVAARFFHQTIFNPGTTTFILSHQAKTTGPLFDMVKRYYQYLPEPLKPPTDTANKNQVKFADIESEYTVGTAGNENLGRGFTIKQLHCSEAAWYEKTDELETGLFQAVADMADTEIIHESTANGMNNMFYRKAIDALHGKGEYILIFIPWFWQKEYRSKLDHDFALTAEEAQLKSTYNLDDQQIYWRRLKIISLGSEWKFKQEYPMNPMEAFVVSGDPFFPTPIVAEARARNIQDKQAPKILGVDYGRTNDRTVATLRQGRKVLWHHIFENLPEDPTDYLVGWMSKVIDREGIKKAFMDYGAGYGVIDRLRTTGYRTIVQGVYFGQGAIDKNRFMNKRAEMYFTARDWFNEGPVDIPDDDEFFADLLITPVERKSPSTGKLFLAPKAEIKKDFGISPDICDSFVLTFAYPVGRDTINTARRVQDKPKHTSHKSELTTLNRIHDKVSESKSVKVNISSF